MTAYPANTPPPITFTGADLQIARGLYADNAMQFRLAVAGSLPAEALSANDREALMHLLVSNGMTDREIERHTGWTLYTVARIRGRLELRANHEPMNTERSA